MRITLADRRRRNHSLDNRQAKDNSAHGRNGGGESISEETLPSSLESKTREERSAFRVARFIYII